MSQSIEVTAFAREVKGTANARRARRENRVPAVIYGAGKASENIMLDHLQLIAHLDHEAFYSQVLNLNIDGKKQNVVLKDLQRHPYKAQIMHVDFLRVKASEALTMKVPVHFVGEEEAPGVKDGGVVSHNLTELEIKCLPKDLPEFIEVNVSAIEMDGVVHLTDVKLPKGVALAHPVEDDEHNHPVFSIHKPKAEVEEEVVEEAAAEEESAEAESSEEAAEDQAKGDKAADAEGEKD